MLATSMARDLGVSTPLVLAGLSLVLRVSAALGPVAGQGIYRAGGKPMLIPNSRVFAIGRTTLALALAQGPIVGLLGWRILGVAMAAGLDDAAFSTLVPLYGQRSRGAITGISLKTGFASSMGWPLAA